MARTGLTCAPKVKYIKVETKELSVSGPLLRMADIDLVHF